MFLFFKLICILKQLTLALKLALLNALACCFVTNILVLVESNFYLSQFFEVYKISILILRIAKKPENLKLDNVSLKYGILEISKKVIEKTWKF